MAKKVGITAELKGDNQQYRRMLKQSKTETQQWKRDVETAGKARMTMQPPAGGNRWSEMGGKVQVLTASLKAAEVAGRGLASIFKADATLEGLIRGLAAVSDGTESVKSQMEALAKVAENPGVDLASATQASIALQAVGMSAAESRKHITEWANVVASSNGSVEDFKGTMVALRQILSKPAVQADDVGQILDRVPIFAGINNRLGQLRDDSKAYVAGALAELEKLPRVVQGTQEAVDNLSDSWEAFKQSGGKVAALVSGYSNAISDVLRGRKNVFDAFKDQGANMAAGPIDPIKKYELTAKQAAEARQRAAETAAAKEKARRTEVNRLLSEELNLDRMKFEMAAAAARQDPGEVDRLQAALDLEKQLKELRKETGKLDADHVAAMEKAAQLRREDGKMLRQIAANERIKKDLGDLEVSRARHMGRDRRADRMEDKKRVEQMVREGADPAQAEDFVRRQREAADDERLGPGRRRIRRRRNNVEAKIPERGAVELPPAEPADNPRFDPNGKIKPPEFNRLVPRKPPQVPVMPGPEAPQKPAAQEREAPAGGGSGGIGETAAAAIVKAINNLERTTERKFDQLNQATGKTVGEKTKPANK